MRMRSRPVGNVETRIDVKSSNVDRADVNQANVDRDFSFRLRTGRRSHSLLWMPPSTARPRRRLPRPRGRPAARPARRTQLARTAAQPFVAAQREGRNLPQPAEDARQGRAAAAAERRAARTPENEPRANERACRRARWPCVDRAATPHRRMTKNCVSIL